MLSSPCYRGSFYRVNICVAVRKKKMMYRLYSLLCTNSSVPSIHIISTVIIVTVHASLYIRQNIYARRNIARGKLYLRGLNHQCMGEERAQERNRQLDKRCAKRKSRRYLTRIQGACCQSSSSIHHRKGNYAYIVNFLSTGRRGLFQTTRVSC